MRSGEYQDRFFQTSVFTRHSYGRPHAIRSISGRLRRIETMLATFRATGEYTHGQYWPHRLGCGVFWRYLYGLSLIHTKVTPRGNTAKMPEQPLSMKEGRDLFVGLQNSEENLPVGKRT